MFVYELQLIYGNLLAHFFWLLLMKTYFPWEQWDKYVIKTILQFSCSRAGGFIAICPYNLFMMTHYLFISPISIVLPSLILLSQQTC